jgi:hypothetical protein
MNKAFVGRELKMVELKERIKELLNSANLPLMVRQAHHERKIKKLRS